MTTPAPWEHRVHRTVVIGQFIALVVAIVSDIVAGGATLSALLAVLFGSAYALGSAAVPEYMYRQRFGVETITLVGAFATVIAITKAPTTT